MARFQENDPFLKGEELFFIVIVTGLRVRLPYLDSKHKLRNEDDVIVISRSARDKWRKSLEAERSRMRRQRAGIDEITRNREMARLRAIKYRYLLCISLCLLYSPFSPSSEVLSSPLSPPPASLDLYLLSCSRYHSFCRSLSILLYLSPFLFSSLSSSFFIFLSLSHVNIFCL